MSCSAEVINLRCEGILSTIVVEKVMEEVFNHTWGPSWKHRKSAVCSRDDLSAPTTTVVREAASDEQKMMTDEERLASAAAAAAATAANAIVAPASCYLLSVGDCYKCWWPNRNSSWMDDDEAEGWNVERLLMLVRLPRHTAPDHSRMAPRQRNKRLLSYGDVGSPEPTSTGLTRSQSAQDCLLCRYKKDIKRLLTAANERSPAFINRLRFFVLNVFEMEMNALNDLQHDVLFWAIGHHATETCEKILNWTLQCWVCFNYPRRARSALGVDTVLTLDVCLFVCLYVCMFVC